MFMYMLYYKKKTVILSLVKTDTLKLHHVYFNNFDMSFKSTSLDYII